jgi:hypothetical protein
MYWRSESMISAGLVAADISVIARKIGLSVSGNDGP